MKNNDADDVANFINFGTDPDIIIKNLVVLVAEVVG